MGVFQGHPYDGHHLAVSSVSGVHVIDVNDLPVPRPFVIFHYQADDDDGASHHLG